MLEINQILIYYYILILIVLVIILFKKYLNIRRLLYLLINKFIIFFNKIKDLIEKDNNFMLSEIKELNILVTEYSKSNRFLEFTLLNNQLYDHYNIFLAIYKTLFNNEIFINFGNKKVIITRGSYNGKEYTMHHNILVDNNTTYQEFYDLIKDIIQEHYEYGYPVFTLDYFKVRVWNMDELQNKHIKITKNSINIKNKTNKLN